MFHLACLNSTTKFNNKLAACLFIYKIYVYICDTLLHPLNHACTSHQSLTSQRLNLFTFAMFNPSTHTYLVLFCLHAYCQDRSHCHLRAPWVRGSRLSSCVNLSVTRANMRGFRVNPRCNPACTLNLSVILPHTSPLSC